MSGKKQDYPYKSLGLWLRSMRQKGQQSLAEVSGAVEIDAEVLSDIERGIKRPEEDVLMLLISYFSIAEDEVAKIWEMAGYNKIDTTSFQDQVQPVLVMPMDARIIYTDMAHVASNKYGVTINFMQANGIGGQPLAVSRVGMSHEHAQKLLNVLEESLRVKPQKLLSSPDTPKKDTSEK